MSFLQKTAESINRDVKAGTTVVLKIDPPDTAAASSPAMTVSAVTTASLPGGSYVMPTDMYHPEEKKKTP